MRKLSLQWRLTLATAALTTVACALLALFFNLAASAQIMDLANFVVDTTGMDGTLEIEIAPAVQSAISAQVQSQLNLLWQQTFWGMSAVVLLASGCTYVLAGRVLAPLRSFAARIDSIQARNLAEPLPEPAAQDEIARLTHSFNAMLKRLNDAFDAQKLFAANAAHELRTPLAVLQTGLDVLQKQSGLNADALREGIGSAQAQTSRLAHLIGELLEMTRLETIERNDRVSLHDMIEEIFCDLAGIAEEKRIALSQNDGDAMLTANDALLYRAFYNIIENGIKYNSPGGNVAVHVHADECVAHVTIADTGMGIPEEYHSQVFAPFFRVDKSRSRAMGGAGLGLALTQAIIERHGGTIRMKSAPGKGTEITVSLPCTK